MNKQPVPLEKEVEHVIEEARMVLPGIQALFGFQLIAVFNQRFEVLGVLGRWLHLLSIVLVAISIAMIMAPAAYHRQAQRGFVSREFSVYASRIITVAMAPLMFAIVIDVILVSWLITHSWIVGDVLGALLLVLYGWFWFVLPQKRRREN